MLNKIYECISDTNMEFKGSQHNKENTVKKYQPLLKSYKIELFVNIAFDRLSCSVCSVQLRSSAPPTVSPKYNFWLRLRSREESESFAWARALALNSWPRHSGPVFCSSRFSIVNEEDRRGRGLLVLIYPEGSLGITINSQLLAHSTRLHRHCQFVPIREAGFWVSAVRSRSGPTGESDPDRTGLDYTVISWGVENSP